MRTHLIFRDLSICEEPKEEIYDVVIQRPAVLRVRRRLGRIIGEDVRQKGAGHPRCFRRRVSTGVLKRVCEDAGTKRASSAGSAAR